jgi:hypothetical protein
MALANHRTWLLEHAEKLFSFFERRLINPLGGFYELDEEGRPTAPGYDAADKAAGTFSQPQGSFALTPPLISWVGQAWTSSLITELVFCGVATATPTTLGKGDPIYGIAGFGISSQHDSSIVTRGVASTDRCVAPECGAIFRKS